MKKISKVIACLVLLWCSAVFMEVSAEPKKITPQADSEVSYSKEREFLRKYGFMNKYYYYEKGSLFVYAWFENYSDPKMYGKVILDGSTGCLGRLLDIYDILGVIAGKCDDDVFFILAVKEKKGKSIFGYEYHSGSIKGSAKTISEKEDDTLETVAQRLANKMPEYEIYLDSK